MPHSSTDPHGPPSDTSQERIKGIGALMECLGGHFITVQALFFAGILNDFDMFRFQCVVPRLDFYGYFILFHRIVWVISGELGRFRCAISGNILS